MKKIIEMGAKDKMNNNEQMETNKQVDIFYDILDEACMLLYKELHIDYLQCLLRAGNDILEGLNDAFLSLETIKKLEKLYDRLEKYAFSNESIRLALNLLLIKGIKHNHEYKLDIIIPDSIGLIFANIIRSYYEDDVSILELELKTGNLINTIANFLPNNLNLLGIEEDEMLAKLAKMIANMQDNDLLVYYNKLLDPLEVNVDLIIGHLESKVDNGYLPYKIINKYLKNLEEDGLFIFLIDNDFFNYEDVEEFKNKFTGTMLGLLILPDSLFVSSIKKSILIGTKEQLNDFQMLVTMLPDFKDAVKLNEAMIKIENWLKEIKLRNRQ